MISLTWLGFISTEICCKWLISLSGSCCKLITVIQSWTLDPQIYPVITKNEQELMVKLQETSKDKPFLLPTFTHIVSKEETGGGGQCMVSFILYA